MRFTLDNVSSTPSYDILKRNGLSDENIIQYYALPNEQRSAFFKTFNVVVVSKPKPIVSTPKVGTQMCTVDIDSVRDMALEHMAMDFEYRGQTFNMNQLGWKFAFNDRKRALGQCHYSCKTIYLSQWFIEHNTREMKMWINTMVHEIAHAINFYYYGGRGHDWRWRDIFMSFGGDGKRCSSDAEFTDLIDNPISKYTLVCPNGHTRPSYKIMRRSSSCGKCNKERGLSGYQEQFKMKQIKNY